MSSPESSPSLFVQRLDSSQVKSIFTTDSSQVESVYIQTRVESRVSKSHESTRPGFPNWLCGRGNLFYFGPHPISVGKQ